MGGVLWDIHHIWCKRLGKAHEWAQTGRISLERDNQKVSNSPRVVPHAPAAFDRAYTFLPLGPSLL
jgi:hypothetical protein